MSCCWGREDQVVESRVVLARLLSGPVSGIETGAVLVLGSY